MNPTPDVIRLLSCPFCSAELVAKTILRSDPRGGIEYGLLGCTDCGFEYPIVGGITILMAPHEAVDSKYEMSEVTQLAGPSVEEIGYWLKNNEPIRAFSVLLNPAKIDENWFFALEPSRRDAANSRESPSESGRKSSGRMLQLAKKRLRRFVLPQVRMRLAEYLIADGDRLSAFEAMDLYYRRYSRAENFNYFAYRFGQPRHLAALSLASQHSDTSEPILDLACGVGQMAHYLAGAGRGRKVIGVDREFFRLWVAHRYVAPEACFIYAPADRALPFRGGVFGGVFCSDAFHCFLSRAASVREMRRVLSPNGILTLARFGNRAVEPKEGYELTIDGYARLFAGMRHVFVGEDTLIRSYMERRRPDLHESDPRPALEGQKWLSLVASERDSIFRRGEPFDDWPHALGRLRFNPIYDIERNRPDGDLDLQFRFPSAWYQFENAAYLSYAPERCRVPAELAKAVEKGIRNPALEEYIAKFVVIGTPQRYC